MIVGLRHDLDTVYGLRWGLPKIISIEKKMMLGLPYARVALRRELIHKPRN
jgi:hypothetical protein